MDEGIIRLILGIGGQAKDVPWGLNKKAADVVQEHGEAGKSYSVLSLVEPADMVHPGSTVVLVEEELLKLMTAPLDAAPADVAQVDAAALAAAEEAARANLGREEAPAGAGADDAAAGAGKEEVLDQEAAAAAEGGDDSGADAPPQEGAPAEAGSDQGAGEEEVTAHIEEGATATTGEGTGDDVPGEADGGQGGTAETGEIPAPGAEGTSESAG